MFTSQEWVSEETISAPFDALKERLIQWKEKRDSKCLAAAPISFSPCKLHEENIGHQGHFCYEDDDELEEYEQSPDIIKAYSMVEA